MQLTAIFYKCVSICRPSTQIVCIMQLTSFLLLGLCLHLSAAGVSQTISFSGRDVPLEQIFKAVNEQTGYFVSYKASQVRKARLVTIDGENIPIEAFLHQALKDQPLDFIIEETTIFIKWKRDISVPASIQPLLNLPPPSVDITLSGVVTNHNNEPLEGVSVVVRGTQNGTVTDAKGRFQLSVPSATNVELEFSFVGFKSKTVGVGSQTVFKIIMEQAVAGLEDIVVVGYGTQKKRDVTGAISSVPLERLDMVPSINVAQVLQGSVPGVLVQQSVGGANPQNTIMIRGRNSILASNDPLIILDGIPYSGNLGDINVNEISSIEVLKDASSTAIYGSRGANGVIIITSKIGGDTKAPKFSYDGKYSIQRANNMPSFMSPEEFYEFKEIREPGNITPTEQNNYVNKSWTDWRDGALRDGKAMHHNLSLNGGVNKTKYYLSGNFLNVEGQTLNDEYSRFNGRLGLQTTALGIVKVGANMQVASTDFGKAPINWEDILRMNPLTSAYDASGNRLLFPWPEFIDILDPLDPVNYKYSRKSFQLLSNNYAEIRIPRVDGLSYRINFGFQKTWSGMNNYAGRNTGLGYVNQGYYESLDEQKEYLSLENIVNYKRQFGKHSLDLTGVYSFEQGNRTSSSMEARGFPQDFITKYSIAQANFKLPGFDYYKTNLIGQMLRLNYNYDSRYLLTLTGRRDGYSGFGANKKWGIFPSVAVGWNIAEESFGIEEIFQELKLRVSYGINGNQAVNAYETISRLGENNYVTGSTSLPGYIPVKLGQDELGWESSKTYNFGLDFSLLGGKVSGTVNYYDTDTYDLLLNRTISPVHGISSITQNIGKTNNKGIEAALKTFFRAKAGFQWNLEGNMAINKNKIVSLYGLLDKDGNEIDDLANFWFINQPISVNYDLKAIGVWQTNEAEEAAKFGNRPGGGKALDVNGDYKITVADDRVFIGQRDPSFTWGLNNTFAYKSFNLSIFFHGIHGVTKLNRLLQDASSSSGIRRNVIKKDWWTPDNPSNTFPENSLSAAVYPIYENASFVRLKDVTLSYLVKSQVLSKLGLSQLRFYINLRNMLTWTDWSTNDPELTFDRGVAPLAKEFVFGLNFNF